MRRGLTRGACLAQIPGMENMMSVPCRRPSRELRRRLVVGATTLVEPGAPGSGAVSAKI